MHKLVLLVVLLSLCSFNAMAQAPQITQISPAPNTTAAVSSANITITWNTALSSTTANAGNIKVWGSQTGLLSSGITLSSNGTVITIDPVSNFKAGEQIYVWIGTGIQSTTNTAMATSQNWSFTAAAQGDGNFNPSTNYPSVSHPISGITAGDTDGDGDLDIIQTDDYNAYFVFNSNGEFDPTISLLGWTPFMYYRHPILFDFDNDGDLDMGFSFSDNNNMSFYRNDGSNTQIQDIQPMFSSSLQPIFSSLLNTDDDFDVVGGERYYLNNGSINFSIFSLADVNFSIPGDITGDNHQDIVAIENHDIVVYSNDGVGNFSATTQLGLSGMDNAILRLADIDGDGNLDIVSSGSSGTAIYANNGNGSSFTANPIASIPETSIFEIADFNGDGSLDIVYAANSYIYTSINQGNFTFSTSAQIGCYTTIGGISIADINNDLKMDILVAGGINDIKVYLNSPSTGVQLSTSAMVFAATDIGSTTTTSVSLSFTTLSQNTVFTSNSTNFTLSLDNTTFVSTTTVTTGATSPQTIYIRFTPSSIGTQVGTISSLGCLYTVNLSGEGTVPEGMVVNTLNSGPGSLRYALENATSGTVITFAGGLGNIFTITGSPITIHHPLSINFQSLTGGGNIIINSGASAAIQFNCGSVGTVLTGLSVISSHPSGGVISTCPDIRPAKVQKKQIDF